MNNIEIDSKVYWCEVGWASVRIKEGILRYKDDRWNIVEVKSTSREGDAYTINVSEKLFLTQEECVKNPNILKELLETLEQAKKDYHTLSAFVEKYKAQQ